MRTLLQDIRYGVRGLLKRPGFAAVAVVTLALGIGANTAIFTVIDAALLRSLPYGEPDRLVHLWETKQSRDFERREASYPDFQDWRRESSEVFEGLAGYVPGNFTLTGGETSERVRGVAVTADFFDVLGVRAASGRTFQQGEDVAGAERVAVVSQGFWQRRMGSDPRAVGRSVTLDGAAFSVVGVLPAGFNFANVGEAELWVALVPPQQAVGRRYMHWINVVGRLKEGVRLERAREQMAAVARRIEADDPGTHAGTGIRLVPLQEEFVGSVRTMLFVLLGAVGLVLLIACVNVANLLLARSASRRREIAVRVALGAGRWRLMRQLLTESVVLSAAGGAAGLVLALWGVELLVAVIPAAQLARMPYLQQLSLNPSVLLFTCGVSLATGLLFGLAPALDASRTDLRGAMQDGGRGSGGRRARVMRDLLVVSEVALSLVLLVGAGLLLKSLSRMFAVDPGFRTENLLTTKLTLPASRYAADNKAQVFHEDLLKRVSALPGVSGAALVSNVPLSGEGGTATPQIVGMPAPAIDWAESHVRVVSPNYFDVMGIPVLNGRAFDERDRADSPAVLLVNRTFAERLLAGEDPTRHSVTFKFTADQPPLRIVGVVGDEKVTSLDARTTPVIYFPLAQGGPGLTMNVVARTSVPPESLVNAFRAEARAIDPEVPLFAARSMEQVIGDSRATFMRRYPTYLLGVFAAVALLLSVVGIYGVVSYSVAQRTREIAIRVALGARGSDVLRLVLRQGMLLALGGVALGIAGSLALTRLMAGMLFGVSAADPATYAGVSLLLAAVALVACLVPARRATKVNPTDALRYE